jgi:sodium-dependent dicarboxylate transporter 2/3/5
MSDTEHVPPASVPSPSRRRVGLFGLFAGPLLGLLAAWLLPSEYHTTTGDIVAFSAAGRATAALAVWMAVWWMTEAIPVYATALLPLGLLPLLGAGSAKEAAAPYGNELIFLFLGGFLMALSMQRWGLDRRIAFGVLRLLGTRADLLVLGLMAVTAFLSMWVSNTASMLTLYPVALSVLVLARAGTPAGPTASMSNFSHALLLGVAYAASIGGMATMIGTPPNLFLASYARDSLGLEISFAGWMAFGVPLMLLFLPAAWWLLVRVFPIRGLRVQGVDGMAGKALAEMGRMSVGEKATIAVFGLAVIAWVFRPLLAAVEMAGVRPFSGLTDSGVAILAALILFVFPAKKGVAVLDWETAKKVPYGLLILFGGGLSLAAAIERNGVGEYLGQQMGALQGVPMWAFIAVAGVGVLFMGELLSNTAMAATVVPICAAVAAAMGWDVLTVLLPVTLAASCGFMLPVATPPNAIAYGSGEVDAQAMLKAGFWLNWMGIGLILGVMWVMTEMMR